MSKNTQLQGELVMKELDKYPNTPTLTLARKLFNENKEVFMSVETARSRIRYYRGVSGGKNLKKLSTKKYLKAGELNPFNIPDSDANDNDAYKLPESITRLLIMSDIHLPYHDVEAITAALKYGKEKKVNGILLNGDILDFYQMSRFDKDPRHRHFSQELESARQLLKSLKDNFNCPIYYKLGNHEERYEKYLRVKAPELLDVAEFKLNILLRFAEFNTHLIEDQRVVMFGKLPIVHGHEFQSKAGGQVNPARSLFLKANHTSIVAHSHIVSEHTETNIKGEIITTWSQGCLCGLSPEYARLNKWSHGFIYVERSNGDFKVENKRVYKGEVL